MFGKQREVFVYNTTKETFLALRVKVADAAQVDGLLDAAAYEQLTAEG